ncbi:MAG: hypothetical protein NT144_13875 [Bacteroidia bacterium]|nr:hypothetical protein [Bacteroidia bacterium]
MTKTLMKKWHSHEGTIAASSNGFDLIDCKFCGFKHIIPIPTAEELEQAYQHDYYTKEKPLYIERFRDDLDWWNIVYSQRYEILERHLPDSHRSLLDIGSGPGYFLLNGQKRGWNVRGIEPSVQAAEHSRNLGFEVNNTFFLKKLLQS